MSEAASGSRAAARNAVRIAVEPAQPDWLLDAVAESGATLAAASEAHALIWTEPAEPAGLAALLAEAPAIGWIQLPWAGVEPYLRAGVIDSGRRWTAAKGVYARPVAEHALALTLAALRCVKEFACRRAWGPQAGGVLRGARVTILGRGGIATEYARLLTPFDCELTCLARVAEPVDWAHRVLPLADRRRALAACDVVLLALSLSAATEGVIGADELRAMPTNAVLVNVARGAHVVTDELARALREGWIAGAALDVTAPEPLPAGHPLWELPNCLITPHTAVPADLSHPYLVARIVENIGRFAEGRPLLGLVDPVLGY